MHWCTTKVGFMVSASIVITCYNLGSYLHEALQSALAQTYADFEVLLIDDGSTDPETVRIVDTLPVNPLLRVIRTANQGVARARNHAIAEARGKYFLPLDADDRIHPEYLAQAIAILELEADVGFVGCHYRVFGERRGEYRPAAYQLPELLVENVVPIASIVRRSCWEEVGGYCAELNSIEDWDLWIGILERGYRAVVLPEVLFEYRVRLGSNLSHMRDPALFEERMRLLYRRHAAIYHEHGFEVLAQKDRQFAQMHSFALWQEEQAKSWERVAQERSEMIQELQHNLEYRAGIRRWYARQYQRWSRIVAENPTRPAQLRALLQRSLAYIRRKLSI